MNVLFPIKIGGLEFLIRVFALVCIGTAANWLTDRPGVSVYWFWGWFALYNIYGVAGLMVPRIRDAGFSPYRLLLFLIPFVNLWICIILFFCPTRDPRKDVPNKLRPNTAPSRV